MGWLAWMEEIRIASDGAWYFNGGKMFRMEIVSLLASHLQLKDEQYFICWRGQEVAVVVEDVPYVITGVSVDANGFKARLADDREMILPERPIVWQNEVPYISLFSDSGVDTKLSRAAFWQITPYLKEEDGQQWIRCPQPGEAN